MGKLPLGLLFHCISSDFSDLQDMTNEYIVLYVTPLRENHYSLS